ncbi:MAG: BMP family ABC transporter substrate-binding protein [Sphaerochaetaceae bacterium]|nr:BMP family ABC transporter substrate-binding protein [Sphaerochaetaceae bacterium]
MKRKITLVLVMALLSAMVFAGGSSEKGSTSGQFKIAVMFGVGGLGDQSFNDNINNAIVSAKSQMDFAYDYVEPKAVSEFESFLREFAQAKEYGLIVVAGSDAADACSKIAKEYPDQHFMLLDSGAADANVMGVTFKDNESTFLGGYAASLITRRNKIGVIGALDIDVINGFIAGWEAGAKHGNPDITVYRSYCGGFADPITAKEMAVQMYKNGADIIFAAAGGSGLGVFQAAEETGNLAVGVDSNQNPIKPDSIVMSCVRSFTAIMKNAIQNEMDGKLQVGTTLQVGILEDAVDCTFEGSNVPVLQSVKDAVEALKLEVKAGKVAIPSKLN